MSITDDVSVDELSLDGSHLVVLPAVVVDDGHVVVTNVSLLLVELRVSLVVWHQRGRVVNHLHGVVLPDDVEGPVLPVVETAEEDVGRVDGGDVQQGAQP